MATIKVPKTPKSAFNPRRPASALLQSQVRQLEWAVRPAAERKPLRIKPVRTEGQAAARIAQLTAQLHPEGAQPAPPASATAPSRHTARQRRAPARKAAPTPTAPANTPKTRKKHVAKGRRKRS
jgi:hypothetical protein